MKKATKTGLNQNIAIRT